MLSVCFVPGEAYEGATGVSAGHQGPSLPPPASRKMMVFCRKEFEAAYRIVSIADDDDDDVMLDLGEVIGVDRLHLLSRFQDLKALETELSRRL